MTYKRLDGTTFKGPLFPSQNLSEKRGTYIQIPTFPDYLINQFGDIVSTKGGRWKHRKVHVNRCGYCQVGLRQHDKSCTIQLHRLVAKAWLGPSSLTVNHINGIKTDNRLDNLEYCSQSDNANHAYKLGLKNGDLISGERSGQSKLTNKQVLELRNLAGKITQRDAAKMFSISKSQVGRIWRGQSRCKYFTKD